MDFQPGPRAEEFTTRVKAFIDARVMPLERAWRAEGAPGQGEDWHAWQVDPRLEALKAEARAQGLWNLFLPDPAHGPGLSTLEYAPVAEAMGRSLLAPEVFNCSAPDTGNMEVLAHYASDALKARWLVPLLAGEIRSVFCMTEPGVASSDATNMEATAVVDGDAVVLHGRKWWSTGLGHPNARVAIFMGRTPDPARGKAPAAHDGGGAARYARRAGGSACSRCWGIFTRRRGTARWCLTARGFRSTTCSAVWVGASRSPRRGSGPGVSITACAASAPRRRPSPS
jgi:alkylation response protein AidB-like acyl-CoA dehydrogenase